MRTSTSLQYSQDPRELAARAVALERAGLDIAWVAEATPSTPEPHGVPGRLDAGAPDRGRHPADLHRTPTLTAMTAAGVDALSGGRCILGLGASGPQVIGAGTASPTTSRWAGPGRSSRSVGRSGPGGGR